MKSISGKILNSNNVSIGNYTIESSNDSCSNDLKSLIKTIPKEFIETIIEQYELYPNKIYEYINYKVDYHKISNNELELKYKDNKIHINFNNWKEFKNDILLN